MKMMKNLASIATLALAAVAAPFAAQAAGNGNIYEIRVVDETGAAIAAPTSPIGVGETVRFVVRLAAPNRGGSPGNPFHLVHIPGFNSEAVDWVVNRPWIGVFVNGKLTPAYLEQLYLRAENFTDLRFSYTVKSGDFALPIRLANEDMTMVTDQSSDVKYYVNLGTGISGIPAWRIDDSTEDGTGATCTATFQYGSVGSGGSIGYPTTNPDGDRWGSNYDLTQCNFNIRTITFDTPSEEERFTPGYWRTVPQGEAGYKDVNPPRLVLTGMPTNSVKLYLWSEDESVFWMAEGAERDIHVTADRTEKRRVLELDTVADYDLLIGGYEFQLRGADAGKGKAARIVLSAFQDFNYYSGSATPTRIADYLTEAVYCGEPSAAKVTIKPLVGTITAKHNYTVYQTVLDVNFNKPFSEDVEVEIVPSFTDGSNPNKWWDYIRVSASGDDDPTLVTPTANPKVLIPAGSKVPTRFVGGDAIDAGKIYVYALRSDSYVTGSKKMTFAVKTDNAQALKPSSEGGLDGWNDPQSTLVINGEKPVITSVLDGAESFDVTADFLTDFHVSVSDVYADMQSDEGYEIWVVKDVPGKAVKLDGLFKPGKNGTLYSVTDGTTLPQISYSGEKSVYKSTVTVVSPISRNESAKVEFVVNVSTPVTYTVTSAITDEGGNPIYEFNEGEQVSVSLTFRDAEHPDAKNTQGDIYAYLKGEGDTDAEAVSCTWKAAAGGKGVKLSNYDYQIPASRMKLELLDGDASKLGSTFTYEIVFLKTATWTDDAAQKVTVYKQKQPLQFTTHNVIPSVDLVRINDEDHQAGDLVGPFPISVKQRFSVVVNEPGEVDKTATGDAAFCVRWKFTDAYGSSQTQIVKGNPDETFCDYDFPAAGEYTITVDLKDKDMGNKYGDGDYNKSFVFKATVIDQPSITVETLSPYQETDSVEAGGEASLNVVLGLNNCDVAMDVLVTVTPYNTDTPGTLLLQEGTYVKRLPDVPGEPGQKYIVTFPKRTTTLPILIQSMDGTLNSRTTGFKIDVKMLSENIVPNSGGKRACDYYVGVAAGGVKVQNVAPYLDPEVDVYPVPGTNEIKTAIGQVDEAITWTFTDVPLDFTRPNGGVTVEFKGGGGWGPNKYTSLQDALAAGAKGFRPSFSQSGQQTVKLIITDPDGGVTSVSWVYFVATSKTMTMVAHGPASGNGAANSKRYRTAAGLGEGRVWAASKSAISVESFDSTVNCGMEKTWKVYGYGYKVDDVDGGAGAVFHYPDGRIGYYTSRDTGINSKGDTYVVGDVPYAYAAKKDANGNAVDSFLYCWLQLMAGESGSETTDALLNTTTLPEYSETTDTGATVSLPTEADDDGGYQKLVLEAVFSREYLASDNMGDINQDGIPDIYVDKYGMGVVDTAAGTVAGDDLTKLHAFNDDEDYLPASDTAKYATLIPGLAGTWATVGRPFTAKLEIRGYGDGLNDAPANNSFTRVSGVKPDRVYTNPKDDSKSTLTYVEWLAWCEYARMYYGGEKPWENPDYFSSWSPERPTDPTVADTDGDGFTDGYEYYIWYGAHVGYLDAAGNHRYLTGRKYDPRHPGEGTRISRETIAALFDPAVAGDAATAATRDTDNDGLPDLLEFELGTNPVDFDTDGDGLPDGYEILIAGLDPLTAYTGTDAISDTARNDDGDAMAISSWKLEEKVAPLPLDTTHARRWTFAVVTGGEHPQWYATTERPEVFEAGAWEAGEWTKVTVNGKDYFSYIALSDFIVDGRLATDAVVYRLDEVDPELLTPILAEEDEEEEEEDPPATVVKSIGHPVALTAGTQIEAAPGEEKVVRIRIKGLSEKEANRCWIYGKGTVAEGEVAETAADYGCLALGGPLAVEDGVEIAAFPSKDRDVAFLHYLCYQEFGFDPRTAWRATDPLAARWDKSTMTEDIIESNLGGYTGTPARTRKFTTYDEFLVYSFFLNNGVSMSGLTYVVDESAPDWARTWGAFTTNPQGPNAPTVTGDHYYGRNSENGADTDGDGVPDGWELYVMAGPKKGGAYVFAPPYAGFSPAGEALEKSYFSPFVDSADDAKTSLKSFKDKLNELREFAGTDSVAHYANYSTTIVRPEVDAKWLNKFFPTDPWSADTDGDGIKDGDEGKSGKDGFVYGEPADNGKFWSIPGGGLNPCSVDTDRDGLPDPWELWSKGTEGSMYAGDDAQYSGSADATGNPLEGLTDGMDGTVWDAYTYPSGTKVNHNGVKVVEHINRDYDRDGLENWQEYLTGTMRCWRYDDPVTSLTYIPEDLYYTTDEEGNRTFDVESAVTKLMAMGLLESESAEEAVGEFWYKTLVDATSVLYNPHFITGTSSGAQYFSKVVNGWDVAYDDMDLSGNASGTYYWFCNKIDGKYLASVWGPKYEEMGLVPCAPVKYASCSPIDADSDRDGLDDYYEVFHGMNPLLGESGSSTAWVSINTSGAHPDSTRALDLVYDSLGGAESCPQAWGGTFGNYWTLFVNRPEYTGKKPRGTGYDFEIFPWLNGLADADPDGDAMRNQEEAIMGSVSPITAFHHSDPTPLWMTDSSYTNSLVRMCYRLPVRTRSIPLTTTVKTAMGEEVPGFTYQGETYLFSAYPGFVQDKSGAYFGRFNIDQWAFAGGEGNMNFIASFEENEGFDTDHDGLNDDDEVAGKYRGKTDPLDADSPRRRQAMYFQGPERPSILQTMPTVPEEHPLSGYTYPDDLSFLHYTVECWVKPESLADATVIERASWVSDSNPGDQEWMRCNFQIGIKSGKWYTKYDPNDTTKGVVEVFSDLDATTEWTHLAAAYDGETLVLYVNGEKHGYQSSGLQPAYGASAIWVTGQGGYIRSADQALAGKSSYQLNAIILGASAKTCKDGATDGLALDLQQAKGWTAYTRFFKGYIDEVRVWDGARSVSEIAGDMKTRYTAELAAKNRSDFYEKWSLGGASDQYRGRYAKDANGQAYDLPAELRYHWAFDSVFGAVDEARVAKVPSGFDFAGTPETTARARLSRPEGYEIAWWTKILTGYEGTVYNSPAWVEWIPSTVAHLPRYDGTTLDSVYWSEDFKGAQKGSYTFARTAEPVSNWQQLQCLPRTGAINGANYTTTGARHWLSRYEDATNKTSFALLYEFAGRHRNQIGDDLLPLGGAFVKLSETLWDEQGATSNWEINGGSADSADGIPSWWASYANDMYYDGDEEITWSTIVTWPDKLTGLEMTAGEAYLRDLARGYVSNEAGDYAVTDGSAGNFVQTYDMDGSGIPDWWEELYGLVGVDALADSDNDGLPNYVEYLLSEVFSFQGVTFDPTNPRSADPYISDYFFKIGDLYAGEIFTDHDLVDDAWEDIYDETFATRLLWDAYADSDGDGWSNRSENRYAKQCMPTQADKQTHYSAADGLVADYPIPTLELTLNYNEALPDSVRTAPIVVQVSRNPLETADPDATYTIGKVSDAQAGTGTSDKKTTDKTEASYTRTLGKWSNRHVVGTLTPGYLNKNAIALQFCFDPSSLVYTWEVLFDFGQSYTVKRGTRTEYDADRRKFGDWNVTLLSRDTTYTELEGMDLRTDENSSLAKWVHSSGLQLGTIDLTTGAFDLDLGVFKGKLVVNSTNESDYVSIEDQTFRIVYSVNPAVDLPRKLYLGEATTGHIREGKNQVIAFFDLDDSGTYTPGEPYGMANDVDISWKGTKATIEVCESSPVTPRVNLWGKSASSGSSSGGSSGGASGKTADRVRTVTDVYQEILDNLAALHLTDKAYSNALARLSWMETNPIETPTVDQTEDVRVRVVRWLVDGTPVWRCGVNARVVLDKKFRYREGEALTEASILADGSLDLDWEYLQSEVVNNMGVKVEGLPVSKVDYLIVIGDGVTSWAGAADSNNVVKALSQVITRYYGATRKTPVVYSPSAERDQIVRSANPTFKWMVDEEPLYGYTAFKVQVADASGTKIYESDVLPAPARDANGCYVWTAPLFVGDKTMLGAVYANNADYTWKVTMYNAKYRTDSFSAGGTYKQATQVDGFSYGTANVAVKYFGPAASYAGKAIRVRAYTTPDFTGTPVAGGYIADPDDPVTGVEVSGRKIEKNCELIGLPSGTYYLQAFIDSNGNGVCDPWESMGYLCDRTGATADWLNPVGYAFEKDRGPGDLAIIYLEDADTDGDALPDAWEYAKYGSLTAKGVTDSTLTAAGEALVSKELESDLLKKAKAGSASSGLAGHLLTSFNSSRTLAALVSGVDPATLDPDITFTISDFAFDATAGEVTLKVAAEVASMGGSFENDMFTVRSGDTLSFQVYQAPAPVGPWTAVGAVQSVKVTAGAVGADGLLRVKPEGVNAEGGFYTVRLVK